MQRDCDVNNRQAAGIILADPERYGPGMLAWARLWIERHGAEPAGDEQQPARGQMALNLEETRANS